MKTILLAAVAMAMTTAAYAVVPAQNKDSQTRSSDFAETTAILKSLPFDVQQTIEGIRQSCRELGPATSDYVPPKVTEGDEGLRTFTVSGAQAVLIDELNFCGNGGARMASTAPPGSPIASPSTSATGRCGERLSRLTLPNPSS